MSLITIDRSLLASSSDKDCNDSTNGTDNLDSSSRSSQSEDFLMCKATAVGLNVRSRRRSSYIKPNDDIQDHLKKILSLLRFGDYVQLVVRLQSESSRSNRHRYCCVISTNGKQGTEESAILGIDITDRRATVGLVLPIWQDMSVKLYGDGGFELITKDTEKQFKPVSVQALWAAFQAVNRACQVARTNAYYSRGLTHDWVGYYHSLPASDTYQIQEWLKTDDIDSFNCYVPPPSPISEDSTDEEKERAKMEALLRLRERLEEELGQSLRDYRHFIEEEVLIIYGRMDAASVIFDHLLLGTTFNASNRAELERRSVTHILNVTREVDNFFPGEKYEYRNIRVFDDERSSLLSYFEETHRFINEAKAQGTTCLVHCKMGISRSATTVIAYVMKELNFDLETALAFVKCRRPCVQPNPGFMRELRLYQGILEASSNRHKPIFCGETVESPLANSRSALPSANTSTEAPTDTKTEDLSIPGRIDSIHSVHGTEDCCSISARSTPTPQNDSPSVDTNELTAAEALDLESELFIYKSQPGDRTGAQTESKLPCSTSVPTRSSAQQSCTDNPLINGVGPQVVWDLNADDDYKSSKVDRAATVLAENHHCLRQWHPDLAENINRGDVGLITRVLVKSTQSVVHFADVNLAVSIPLEQAIEEAECPKPVQPVLVTLDCPDMYATVLDACIITHVDLPLLSRPVVSQPLLMYTSVERHLNTTEISEPLSSTLPVSSESLDSLLTPQVVRPSYVLRMVCKLTESGLSRPSLTYTKVNCRSSITTPSGTSTRSSLDQSSFRRITYPSYFIRSSGTVNNLDSGTVPKRPISPIPHGTDRVYRGTTVIVPSSSSTVGAISLCDPNTLDRLTSGSDFSSEQQQPTRTYSPLAHPFRSLRSPSGTTASSISPVVNRSQSTRSGTMSLSLSSRLRPDDSWIVCPPSTTNSHLSAKTNDDIESTHCLRPMLAVLNTPCLNKSFPQSVQQRPDELLSSLDNMVPELTVQAAGSDQLVQVPLNESSLVTSKSCPLFTEISQCDCPSLENSSLEGSVQPDVCDRVQDTSFLTYHPVRRIVNWPPQAVNAVGAKSC
ncbi:hypothetical protein PHET_03915 [Paragonimus heterotremus]|uniref:protein-serine/threonine phosphatase n=1 Tax=Paragonimus heterotremus TaxID=100268 RepID=A0A8J4SQX7_9TREM|nr:hypothetical protein PHET_03915 [Paragonimus heterotremus]